MAEASIPGAWEPAPSSLLSPRAAPSTEGPLWATAGQGKQLFDTFPPTLGKLASSSEGDQSGKRRTSTCLTGGACEEPDNAEFGPGSTTYKFRDIGELFFLCLSISFLS